MNSTTISSLLAINIPSHKLKANYLAERFQYVRVHDKSSAMKSIKRGVPQGRKDQY